MVDSRRYLPRLEEERHPILDPWQSYASPALSAFITAFININSFPDFAAGAGKSIIWYVDSHLLLW